MACQAHALRRQDAGSSFDLWRGIIQSTCSCVLTLGLPPFALPLRSSCFLPQKLGQREQGRLAGRGTKVWIENPDGDDLKCNRQVVAWRKDEGKDSSIEETSGDAMHLSKLHQGNAIFIVHDVSACRSRLKSSAKFYLEMTVRRGGERDFLSFELRKH